MKTLIIAEAGVNHNGSFEIARQLIDAAAASGADYVKFQTFKANKLVSRYSKKAEYQIRNTGEEDDSQYQMLKKLEMPLEWHTQLIGHALKKGIRFLSTGFDEESVDFLAELGIDLFKIPSGEITNRPYLEHIAAKGKPVILSTGMATLQEIEDAIEVMTVVGLDKKNISVLHCNTEYPTPMKDVNLTAMHTIGEKLGVVTGYSDHTLGIEVPIAAVARGAAIIEKHFTLDRNMPGPDHRASLEPAELAAMVSAIRNIELAVSGSGEKLPSESEEKNKVIARKSIHINKRLEKGHIVSKEDLEMKRPGDGISPMRMNEIIGKTVKHTLEPEHKLTLNDIE